MLALIISTVIGGLLIPFIFMGIKAVFKLGSFSVYAISIPIRSLLSAVFKWGKYLVIPLGLLMLMHPAEFSVSNGALSEKLGAVILIVGILYLLRACLRGFTQLTTVVAWSVVALIGAHFYGHQKIITQVVKYAPARKEFVMLESNKPLMRFVPFADPKTVKLHAHNCEHDCLEEVSFAREDKEKNAASKADYLLDPLKGGFTERLDSIYKSTVDQTSSMLFGSSASAIETLPDEAFFGKAPQETSSKNSSVLDQGKSILDWIF